MITESERAKNSLLNTKDCDQRKKGNKKTMRTKEFYNAIATNETLSAEIREFAVKAIEKLDKSNENRATKAAEKKAIENAPIIEAVVKFLNENKGAHTAAEIAAAVGISTPKATAMANKVEGIIKGEGRIGNRIVITYSL